ncbi:hypothetical protein BG006_005856 [Podila minutissima]|uniref:Uncharacterized protein n=1 Tax=Podila minutissima TaxID=64525 RepID=A0A9P5VM21_9FUNG|nr:hypothetical protein BG006_005856 [Podila minutissima]
MAIRDSSQISTALLYFTSYSFTGAAIMGSSVGLVVYQSRQFNTLSRLELSSRQHTQPSELSSTFSGASLSYPSLPAPSGTSLFTAIVSWLPYLVWILSLFATSLFVRRTWIPKQISPRTGILASQVLFGVVWVLLGSVQEALETFVQDSNRLDSAVAPTDDVNGRGPGSLYAKAGQTSNLDQNSLYSMYSFTMAPLCIVWYGAIAALGVATGLLTTSSAICEQQLIREYEDRMAQKDISKEQHQLDEAMVVMDQESTAGGEQSARYRRTTRQRSLLALWVLTLMWAQLQFFQWVMSSRSANNASFGISSLSSATCMTMFSLFTSVTMFMIGSRILPTP